MSVSTAKLTGTRMMTNTVEMSVWYASDWNYDEMCASTHDAYEMREMSGSYPSITFRAYLLLLTDLVSDGAMSGSSALLRSHCTSMRVMFADMIARIDRECAELSELLNSCMWDQTN